MDNRCDLCSSANTEPVYIPIGSKRGAVVYVCNACGLAFTVTEDVPYSREPNPSGDADWGNVRFAKGQRLEAVKQFIPQDKKRVLDVGSSRGDFVQWYKQQNPEAEITAVEPDAQLIDGYQAINARLEDVKLFSNHYDLIFCCQTLEHADSASAMIKQMYKCLAPGGYLFLEVPNIRVIDYPQNVEEFFIDKHNFHFSKSVMCEYLELNHFYLEIVNNDNLNVRILAQKSDRISSHGFDETDCKALIKEYDRTIHANRAKLPDVARKIERIMQWQSVAFWGANTILDLLIKYGGFAPELVSCLVDSYMAGLVQIHGIDIQKPTALRAFHPNVCIVLARHSADAIVRDARNYGIRNVIKFSDLL